MQHAGINPNDMPCSQYIQLLQMALQNGPRVFLYHAVTGSWSKLEPCCQLHIQHAYNEHQHTSSNMLTPTATDAILIHKVPTNFVLDLTQPIQDADHPGGPQAYAMANQM